MYFDFTCATSHGKYAGELRSIHCSQFPNLTSDFCVSVVQGHRQNFTLGLPEQSKFEGDHRPSVTRFKMHI